VTSTETDSPATRAADEHPGGDQQLADALDRIVEQGKPRLHRQTRELLATGAVAGIEVAIGALALIAVENVTGSPLVGGVAFSFGFVALLLGHSELFTEGFLVPVTVVAAGEASVWQVVRLWVGTLVSNLAGGWLMLWIAMTAYPEWHKTAVEAATFYVNKGINAESFCLAIVAGATITLMTRMVNGSESMPVRVFAVVSCGFVIAGLRMAHAVVGSLLIFAALDTGHANFNYLDWLTWLGWATFGNVLGGIGLVTLLRLLRSKDMLERHRREAT
jgi:formate/nitrite transporter FocA (FNT family)